MPYPESALCDSTVSAHAIGMQFDRAAKAYGAHAVSQKQIADTLFERLQWVKVDESKPILDVGSGSGYLTQRLRAHYAQPVYALDLSPQMVSQYVADYPEASGDAVVGDITALPVQSHSVGVVLSSMALHWCSHLDKALENIHEVLVPGGVCLCALAGEGTFTEFQHAWAAVDQASHHLTFPSADDMVTQLEQAGFRDIVVDRGSWVCVYPSLHALHRALKATGVTLPATYQHRPGLRGRRTWTQLSAAYEDYREQEGLPMTYEVIFVMAKKAQTGPHLAGEVHVPVANIRRRGR